MPAQPAWISRLNQILADLEALPCSHLDRHAIEKLFGVSERRARQLMTGLPGLRVGNACAVEKQALLHSLLQMAAGERVLRERRRRARVADHLKEARRVHAARQISLPIQQHSGLLPDGVYLRPAELRVEFQTPAELAARLYALGQVMASDWDAFQAILSDSV